MEFSKGREFLFIRMETDMREVLKGVNITGMGSLVGKVVITIAGSIQKVIGKDLER
jgi:hypothetical protein